MRFIGEILAVVVPVLGIAKFVVYDRVVVPIFLRRAIAQDHEAYQAELERRNRELDEALDRINKGGT